MTIRELRARRASAVIQTPRGGHLYLKHLPRRVKHIVKKGIVRPPVSRDESRRVHRYLAREGVRDQSHRFRLPKAKWGAGPWQDEPDRVDFVHAGLPCLIMRNLHVTGTLNGYVGVPPSHPWWGKDYHTCVATPQCDATPPPDFESWGKDGMPVPPEGSRMRASMQEPRWSCDHTLEGIVEVHGGLTFAAPAYWRTKPAHADYWWFAFDTGHAWDYSPMLEATVKEVYTHQDPTGKMWAAHQRIMDDHSPETYKDLPYVRQQVEQLAEQLAMAVQVKA